MLCSKTCQITLFVNFVYFFAQSMNKNTTSSTNILSLNRCFKYDGVSYYNSAIYFTIVRQHSDIIFILVQITIGYNSVINRSPKYLFNTFVFLWVYMTKK